MSERWPARHFDGETPTPQNVEVGFEPGVLVIVGVRHWPLESVAIVDDGESGGPVQVELLGERSEALAVTSPGFLAALQRAGGQRTANRLGGTRIAARAVLGLTALAAVLLFAAWRWGVPALAEHLARKVPASWEHQLGEAVLPEAAPESLHVNDPAVLEPVEHTLDRLLEAMPEAGGSYQVHVIRSPVVNAYAVPGGHIIVTTAILSTLDGADELAAVLAHEITHLTERHTTRGILEQEGLGLLMGLLSGGDPSLGRIAGAASQIGGLSYSRDEETAADEGAAHLLARAGISPLALARVHERLAQVSKERGRGLEFLSTHPSSSARGERARELARRLRVAPTVSPPDTASWRAMDEAIARMPDAQSPRPGEGSSR